MTIEQVLALLSLLADQQTRIQALTQRVVELEAQLEAQVDEPEE